MGVADEISATAEGQGHHFGLTSTLQVTHFFSGLEPPTAVSPLPSSSFTCETEPRPAKEVPFVVVVVEYLRFEGGVTEAGFGTLVD
jgi:hypothetical protein